MVGVERLELPAPWTQTTCATKLRYTPTFCRATRLIYTNNCLLSRKLTKILQKLIIIEHLKYLWQKSTNNFTDAFYFYLLVYAQIVIICTFFIKCFGTINNNNSICNSLKYFMVLASKQHW